MAQELFPGAQTILYAMREPTYGQAEPILGSDAFLTISDTITPAEERGVRPDRTGSPDHTGRYVGRKSAEWEVTKLLLPSGSVTTEPDDRILWQNNFGRLSMGATSFSYHQATAHSWAFTLRRGQRTGGGSGVGEFQEHVRGAISNRVEIAWGNQGQDDLATVSFAGMGKEWGYSANTTLAGVIATAAATATVDNAKQFSAWGVAQVESDTGGGSGLLVEAVNWTNNQISFALGHRPSTSHSNAAVKPYNPTATTAGSLIHGKLGLLSLDGSASIIDHLGGRVTFEDNRSLLNEEVGYDSPSRVMREDRRDVTFSLDFILKKEDVPAILGNMLRNTANDIQINLGNIPNETVKIEMKKAEFDMSAVDVPDQAMLRVSMSGRALGTAGNDSLIVKFQ